MLIKLLLLILLNVCLVSSLVHLVYKTVELRQRPSSIISVQTSLGTVIGYKKVVQNRTINIFYGLPYAEPPVGKLRFKRPKLIKKFDQNPYYALNLKPHCPQVKSIKYHPNDTFSEDCLYMNIFTPDLNSKLNGICEKKHQVMIYIYGGRGSINQVAPFLDENQEAHPSYSGDYFASLHDTILVLFNFRQDLFASLYMENEFTGNLGLFDQNSVLRWTKKYIGDFCGDDNKLTLFGNSFGSYSTGLHLISRYSKHLINNAIMQSNGGLFQSNNPVTKNELIINSFLAINDLKCLNFDNAQFTTDELISFDKKVRTEFFELSENGKYHLKTNHFLKKATDNLKLFEDEMVEGFDRIITDEQIDRNILKLIKFLFKYVVDLECLYNLSTEQIINVDRKHLNEFWAHYYDMDFIDTEAFLNYKLFNKLNLNPKLNLLIGTLEMEHCSKVFTIVKDPFYVDQFNALDLPKDYTRELIKNSPYLRTIKLDDKEFRTRLADFYTDETKLLLLNGYQDSYNNLVSDYSYICSSHFFANYASMTSNTVSSYVIGQKFSKHFASIFSKWDFKDYIWMQSCHGDELLHLFGLPERVPNQFTDLDREFSFKILQLWTSFARNGKMPDLSNGKKWPVSNKDSPKPKYVEINNKYIRERKFELEERCEQFWRPILPIYKK